MPHEECHRSYHLKDRHKKGEFRTMKANDVRREAELELLHAREAYDGTLVQAAKILHSFADGLKQHTSARAVGAGAGAGATPIHVGSWAINHLTNVQSNLRLDLICLAAARLDRAMTKLEDIRTGGRA